MGNKPIVIQEPLNPKESRAVLLKLIKDNRNVLSKLAGKTKIEDRNIFSAIYKLSAEMFLERDEEAFDDYFNLFGEKDWVKYLSNQNLFEYFIYQNKIIGALNEHRPFGDFSILCHDIMEENSFIFGENVSFAKEQDLTKQELADFHPGYYTNQYKLFFKYYLIYKNKVNKLGLNDQINLVGKTNNLDFGKAYLSDGDVMCDFQLEFLKNMDRAITKAESVTEHSYQNLLDLEVDDNDNSYTEYSQSLDFLNTVGKDGSSQIREELERRLGKKKKPEPTLGL